jgi:hypothetical protein
VAYPRIDPRSITVEPLACRRSYIDIQAVALDPLGPVGEAVSGPLADRIDALAQQLRQARERGASRMLTYGAHLVKNGCARQIIWLLEQGWITHLATQGAGIIHDVEFALTGHSSESVRDNAPVGRFGTWDETGRFINLAALAGAVEDRGLGESVGHMMAGGGLTLPEPRELRSRMEADWRHPQLGAMADLMSAIEAHGLPVAPQKIAFDSPCGHLSVTQRAYELGVPLTVHPGIGYDIFACHPMFHGGAIGRTAGADFHAFAHAVGNLTGGVYLSIGSAIMSPQVFEKAFSVANNLRGSSGQPFITDHHIAVVDIQDGGGWDWGRGEPPMDNPAYYLRWCKTFARMGGAMQYLQIDNRLLLSHLIHRLAKV